MMRIMAPASAASAEASNARLVQHERVLVEPLDQVDAHENGTARESCSRRDLDAAIGSIDVRRGDTGPRAIRIAPEGGHKVLHRSPRFAICFLKEVRASGQRALGPNGPNSSARTRR